MVAATPLCHTARVTGAPAVPAVPTVPQRPGAGAVVLTARDVHKSFGKVEALRGINASVPAGVVGLLGPNGAGKTTLLRLIIGLESADIGDVDVLGWPMPSAGLQVRAEIGYMPEDDCLFPKLNGIQQVIHAAQLCGLSRVDAFSRAHKALDMVGLGEARHRPASGFSLGMRQRLRLAMAIAHGPRLLLLDEPTAGLDPQGRDDMLGLIAEIGAAGTSVLLSTHVLADVDAVCSDVLLLSKGRIGFCGAMEKFRASTGGERWQIDVMGDPALLHDALKKAGLSVWMDAHLVGVRLDAPDHGLMWKIAADHGIAVRGLWPVEEAISDAFMRHLRLDDPARERTASSSLSSGAP